MAMDPEQLAIWGRHGVELCRQGEWEKGVDYLVKALASGERVSSSISSLCYSYLGYGIAKYKGRQREGLAFCEQAVKIEFFQPENQLNLARTHLLMKNRAKAIAALQQGLKLHPDHSALRKLAAEVGERREPVLGFLHRNNFLNVLFGRIRHGFSSGGK